MPLACVAAIALRTRTATAYVTTWTIAWEPTTRAACAMALATASSAVVRTSLQATAIATATNLTPWACVAATALQTRMATACATTWTTAWARSMRVACATVPGTFTNADVSPCPQAIAIATETNWTNAACVAVKGLSSSAVVPTSLQATAIATATNSTPWACVAATAPRMRTVTGCATTRTTAWAPWTIVASATALVPFTNADVNPFLRAIAIATATSWTRLACAGENAPWIWTWMAFATTSTPASETWTNVAFATVPARCTNVGAISCPWEIAIARATKWMPWACAVGAVKPMPTAMGCATTRKSSDAWT